MAAVRQFGLALRFVEESINDYDVSIQAILRDPAAVKYASHDFFVTFAILNRVKRMKSD